MQFDLLFCSKGIHLLFPLPNQWQYSDSSHTRKMLTYSGRKRERTEHESADVPDCKLSELSKRDASAAEAEKALHCCWQEVRTVMGKRYLGVAS